MSDAKRRQEAGSHYLEMDIQPWDVIDTWPREQRIGAYRSGALKYVMRMGSKDESPKEIAKGRHYLEKLLEVLREEDYALADAQSIGANESESEGNVQLPLF